MRAFGVSRPGIRTKVGGLVKFVKDWQEFARAKNSDFEIASLWFCLVDRESEAGVVKGDYFHQDLLVAQQIYVDRPNAHLDIASRIDGFVAHVASFREIVVADIRPISSEVKNVRFIRMDIMNADSTGQFQNKFDSISCLHAIEHFGLGRYGDPVNPEGHRSALRNIKAMLKPGKGRLYLSFPMGAQRIEFNAHRVFGVNYAKQWFADEALTIEKFSYVDQNGDLHRDVDLDASAEHIASFRKGYGCGIFTLRC